MLLDEIEVAEMLGKTFSKLTDLGKIRRVRKLIRKAQITPHIFYSEGKEIWCIPEEYVRVIIQCQTSLKLSKETILQAGGLEVLPTVMKSTKAQEFLTKA